jgi:uncharacterized lipoprotein YmbA
MRKSIAFLILLTGCSFFSKSKNTFYSLETLPGTTKTITGAPLAIEAIELPPGIDRREIATRTADHKLDVRNSQQWAGPLEDMVIHTLAFDLAKRVQDGMVILPGQAKPAAARSIYIVFEDLAAGPDNQFVLDARWTVGTVSTHERIDVPLSSNDSAEIARAMSSALSTLADRIVARM